MIEAIGVAWVGRRLRVRDERTRDLGTLLVVGLHFLPMGIAFGPWIVALGLAASGLAAIGLLAAPAVPLRLLWGSDGVLKLAAGALMLVLEPGF